jgi:hypothetical protein
VRGVFAVTLLLAACNSAPEEASEAEIANRAESLERAADATTDDLINQIEAQAAAEMTAEAPVPAANASNAAQ